MLTLTYNFRPYSSFKGSNHNLAQHNASLSADPNRYRALSLSSPNLGRKKKHHVEVIVVVFDIG